MSVTFVGRLDAGKGADLLPELSRRLADHMFDIYGVGAREQELRRFASESQSFRLHGRVSPAVALDAIATSTVVVVPSRAAESFGLVAAEAMASGVPVITSDRGALPEIAVASGGGIVVEPRVSSLEAAILQVTRSPNLRTTLGANGRRFAQRELAADVGAKRLVSIYEDAILDARSSKN